MNVFALMIVGQRDATLGDRVRQQIEGSGDRNYRPHTREAYRKSRHNFSTVAAVTWALVQVTRNAGGVG